MMIPRTSKRNQAGVTLIEVMMALTITVIVLMGAAAAIFQMDRSKDFAHDRALAHKAAQQMLEVINSEDLPDLLSRASSDPIFCVKGMLSAKGVGYWTSDGGTTWNTNGNGDYIGMAMGKITVQDTGWDSTSGQAYLVTIEVSEDADMDGDPDGNDVYASIMTVRTMSD